MNAVKPSLLNIKGKALGTVGCCKVTFEIDLHERHTYGHTYVYGHSRDNQFSLKSISYQIIGMGGPPVPVRRTGAPL